MIKFYQEELNIKPLNGYLIKVGMPNILGVFNVKACLNLGVFQAFKNTGYFGSVVATTYGIKWKNGQNFSSDTIMYDIKNQ
ncbi:hypothetical protein [uncultured Gammaproteobacteria bacterium]|nr:hypothetical protein [uncultured Gammaproteobacteria bacterium]CAC9965735.1 hypothetical protein [uncultured Gammaproteobacteria bacterium]